MLKMRKVNLQVVNSLHSPGVSVRLLLVEDHKPLARALRQGLEEEGFAVDLAADGEEADHKAISTSYDVIILDVMLPKKDGLTVLKAGRGGDSSTRYYPQCSRRSGRQDSWA